MSEKRRRALDALPVRNCVESLPDQSLRDGAEDTNSGTRQVTSYVSAVVGRLARIAFVIFSVAVLASCGSGGVSGPPPATAAITVTPDTATLFSGLPTTFTVSGGNGNYIVTSSNQAVVAPLGAIGGNAFTIVPNEVAAETTVTVTVSDNGTSTPDTATLTIKPRTLSNTITVTPSNDVCGNAVCAGGDAEVRIVLSQGGIPLVGRQVRFDVVSGDFRFITSPPGATTETLALSAITTTDGTGTALVRVRVLASAGSQTALLQVTDLGSGLAQLSSFTVSSSSTNTALNAQPSTVRFVGNSTGTCAISRSADVIVFGGVPPYNVSHPANFSIDPDVVAHSGDRFTVTTRGDCDAGAQIAVVDSTGTTVTVTASNVTATAPASTPLVVAPDTVTLDTCTTVAMVAIGGGLGAGTYFATSSNDGVTASVLQGTGTLTIRRKRNSDLFLTPVRVAVSDGQQVQEVQVNVTGTALGHCS